MSTYTYAIANSIDDLMVELMNVRAAIEDRVHVVPVTPARQVPARRKDGTTVLVDLLALMLDDHGISAVVLDAGGRLHQLEADRLGVADLDQLAQLRTAS